MLIVLLERNHDSIASVEPTSRFSHVDVRPASAFRMHAAFLAAAIQPLLVICIRYYALLIFVTFKDLQRRQEVPGEGDSDSMQILPPQTAMLPTFTLLRRHTGARAQI